MALRGIPVQIRVAALDFFLHAYQKGVKFEVFDPSIKTYKDCCGIISKKACTNVKIKSVEESLEKIDFDKIVKKSLEEMGIRKG